MAQFIAEMKDNDTTAVLARPIVETQADGTLFGYIEVLKYLLAGSRGAMDPDDPRKTTLPSVPDPASEWVYAIGGPLSRPFDPDVETTYNFNGTPTPGRQDVSWAYWTGYSTFLAANEAAMLKNHPYAVQRHKDWVTNNPPSNDEAWVETPLPVEPIPDWVV